MRLERSPIGSSLATGGLDQSDGHGRPVDAAYGSYLRREQGTTPPAGAERRRMPPLGPARSVLILLYLILSPLVGEDESFFFDESF
jgi:hypothetical protein